MHAALNQHRPSPLRTFEKRSRPGFTLIELLCAMSLAACLLLACGAVMRLAADGHRVVSRDSSLGSGARRVFEQLREDLAVVHPCLWLDGSGRPGDPVGWTMLLAPHSQEPSSAVADLCTVAWELADLPVEGGVEPVVRCLIRHQRDSAAVSRDLREGQAPRVGCRSGKPQPFVEGVIRFEVWPLLRDEPQSWRPWHPELAVLPDALEVRLQLADRALWQALRNSEDWERAAHDPGRMPPDQVADFQTIIPLRSDAP